MERMTPKKELEGLVVKEINVCEDEIMLSCDNGYNYYFYHEQDCCEEVSICHVSGDHSRLKGMRLVQVEKIEWGYDEPICEDYIKQQHPQLKKESIYEDSATVTDLIFRTKENTVCFKWLGTSNGYYSESVDFRKETLEGVIFNREGDEEYYSDLWEEESSEIDKKIFDDEKDEGQDGGISFPLSQEELDFELDLIEPQKNSWGNVFEKLTGGAILGSLEIKFKK